MKVGKAIYNILSQSTDVQSNFPFNTTDYAPTGTELVTNGDFSAGVELLTQPIDLTVDFIPNGSGVIDDSNSFTTTGAAFDGLRNKLSSFQLIDGKSYKLVIEGSTTSSGFTIGSVTANGNEYGAGFGTHYFVATTAHPTTIWIRQQTAGTTDLTTFTIEELGADWTLDAGWSIGDSKAVYDGTGGTSRINQNITVSANKSYKISLTVLSNEGTGGNSIYFGSVLVSSTHLEASATPYVFYGLSDAATELLSIYGRASEVFEVTNITVQEMALTKIFPELAPPDIDAPYIVYSVVSNSPSETKNANGDIDTANIEVYGFQDTYNKAVDLGVSVRAALDRKTGTYNTIEIQSTNYVNEQMDVNEARKLWAAIQDYSIRIKNI